MFKSFIRAHFALIVFALAGPVVFGITFALFDLSWMYWGIPSLLIGVGLVYYLVQAYALYDKEQTFADQLQEVQRELADYKHQSLSERQAIEDYFLMWVHQIKTPITASKLILDQSDHPDQKSLHQELVKIESYAQLAMNYMRLLNPQVDLHISRVNLNEVIGPLLVKYRYHFIDSGLQLVYQPIDFEIITEANLFQILVEQILSNALKYTRAGQIQITWQEDTQQLVIADSGIGILAEDLPKIFHRGFSGHNGQLNEQSSGIGLYLVKMIADRLNHGISVESQVGQGTQFFIACQPAPAKLTIL